MGVILAGTHCSNALDEETMLQKGIHGAERLRVEHLPRKVYELRL